MSTTDLPELPIFDDDDGEGIESVLPEHVLTAEFGEAWSTLVRSLFQQLHTILRHEGSVQMAIQFGVTGLAVERILIMAAHCHPVKVDLTAHLRFRHPVELPEDFEAGMYVFVKGNQAVTAVGWAKGEAAEMSDNSTEVVSQHLKDLARAMNLHDGGTEFGHDNRGATHFSSGEDDVGRDVVNEFRSELETPIHEELIEQFRRELEGGES